MCPVCIATAAWIAAGVTSTGGVSALFAKVHRGGNQPTATSKINLDTGESHEQHHAIAGEDENPARRLTPGMGSSASTAAR